MHKIMAQRVGRLKIEAETEALQQTADAQKWTDAAPEFSQEKPAQHHPGPPDAPGKKKRNIALGVLRTEEAKKDKTGKCNVSKGPHEGKIVAVPEKSSDKRKGNEEVEPRSRIINEEDVEQLSQFLHDQLLEFGYL
jgi:hypothetical protein